MDVVGFALAKGVENNAPLILDYPTLFNTVTTTVLYAIPKNQYIYYQVESSNAFYRVNTLTGTHETLANSPLSTSYNVYSINPRGIALGDYVYVLASAALYRYTISSNSWTTLATPPANNLGFSCDGSNFYVLVQGGSAYKYSISGNSWTAQGGGNFQNSNGMSFAGDAKGNLYEMSANSGLRIWSPVTQTFTTKSSPVAKSNGQTLQYHCVLMPIDDTKLVIISGNGSNSEGSNVHEAHMLNISSNTYTYLGHHPAHIGMYSRTPSLYPDSGSLIISELLSQRRHVFRVRNQKADVQTLLAYLATQ